MHSDVTRLQIEDAGDISTVRLVQTWPTPGPERQVIEMAMGQLMRTLRLYLGVNWQALSVSLPHAPPQVMDTHRRILGKAIQFDQPFAGVVCRRSDLDRVNPVANPEMARHMERLLNDLEHPEEVALALKVRAIVGESLPTRPATAVSVANELGLDPRTLQRQLAVAGTSFVEIVQALRFELASRYLREDDAPLSDVAKRLGFSELSAFSRWHRKHYGQSASAHRGSIRAAERPLSMA
jgi:AraC-like DNA-binding protein